MNEYLHPRLERKIVIGRCTVLLEALNFVIRGVEFTHHRRGLPAFAIKAKQDIEAQTGHLVLNSFDWPKGIKPPEPAEVDPFVGFTDAWLDELSIHGTKHVGLPNIDLPNMHLDRLKGAGCTKQPYKTEAPTVQGAFKQAKRNAAVAQSRLITLYAVMVLSGIDTSRHLHWHEFSDYLHQQLSTFHREIMMFGLLLGGDAAEEAKQIVTEWYLTRSDNMSIMEYLEPDGIPPGQWLNSTEASFRKDILSKAKGK